MSGAAGTSTPPATSPVGAFLAAAVAAAGALARYHERHAAHGALSPQTLAVDVATGTARLLARHEAAPARGLDRWIYLAPEQTGRLQQPVDGRSDLYVLGVLLYERLLGTLPFRAADPLQWTHAHLAVAPRPPAEVDPGVPEVVGALLLKLLAKDPEARYQTAVGLQRDLQRCLDEWQAHGHVAPFALARHDETERLHEPRKLYGRQAERQVLLHAWSRVYEGSGPRVVLLAGGAGVGKSALARELARPVADARGLFVTGKFDEVHRAVPYAPFLRAFGEVAGLLLASDETRLAAWRQRLLDAVGAQGRLLTDLMPELALILGPQPEVAPLPPAEAQQRFATLLRRFAGVFAAAEHPVALFLDDLQWADPASLRLWVDLATDPSLRWLLLVGAWRDDEIDAGHALPAALEAIRAGGAPTQLVTLGPLPLEALVAWTADALAVPPAVAAPLTELVAAKTERNPLFFWQFLTTLQRSGLLHRQPRDRAWTWDAAQVRAQASSANVIDLLALRLARCSAATQHTLALAACLGDACEVATLEAVAEQPAEVTTRALDEAVAEGLVLRSGEQIRFLHDRIRQAAYGGIAEAERPATHRRLGRLLLQLTEAPAVPERVFDLLSQIDRGGTADLDDAERERFAGLNLLAARRARGAAAYRPAADYCATGLAFLADAAWDRWPGLAFSLALEGAECELGSGNLAAAEDHLQALLAHARSRLERAACQRLRITLHTTRGESMAALEAALDCLRLYDLDLPLHPTAAQAAAAVASLEQQLAAQPIERLVDLPRLADPELDAAMAVLAGMLPAAYFADLHLHRIVACTLVEQTLRHGISSVSPMAVAAFGFELAIDRRFAEADRCGHAALGMIERHGLHGSLAKVCNVVGASIVVWTRELGAAMELQQRGVRAGVDTGDILFACLCHAQVAILHLAMGARLDVVEAVGEEALAFLRAARYDVLGEVVVLVLRFVRCMQGRTAGDASLDGPDFDEAGFERGLAQHPLPLAATWFHLHKLAAAVLAGDTAAALASDAAVRPVLALLRGQHPVADVAFYGALARTGAWAQAAPAERQGWLAGLTEDAAFLRVCAASSPESYAHLWALVAAEIAGVQGRDDEAQERYAQAVRSAREHGFVHVEGLAHERAAQACLRRGFDASAEVHLREARAAWRRWGATGKVRQVDRRFPALATALTTALTTADNGHGAADLPAMVAQGLDALAIAQASQAISGEIELDRLLDRLLRVVLAEAGARHAVLLLARPTGLVVAATAAVERDAVQVTVCPPDTPPSSGLLPESVIHYVRRSGTPVLVDDAARHGTFASDTYVVQRKIRSLLCLPILRQGQLQGLLYLDNELIAGAFTPQRQAVLEVLAAQAAISLENAALYADLRREVAERERTEEGLRASQAQLVQAQKMEVVGRLAGGVAHDFNNLLTAIGGYSMLALERLPPGDPVRQDVEEIQKAGERAAALTRQLLAFSRKQVMQARPLVLDAVVTNLEKMLRRLIGEDIELVLDLAPDLGVIKADPGQLEQVLVNLVVNSRDAMPQGGTVTIETRNEVLEEADARRHVGAVAGPYVRLTVRDTGVGMDEATRARVFEPFFTTKPVGQGTGLGLATVYGIVQQSGGHIEVASQPGHGTAFTIHLPCSTEPAAATAAPVLRRPAATGTETLLVVEDDESVRSLTREILAGLGYTVLVATDGADALRVQAAHQGRIDLLVTDVVMPRLSGPELAQRLARLVPGLGVLFVSGYTADAIVHRGELGAEADVLPKPFTPDALARKVREVLDRVGHRTAP